jgi:adenine-specific DNA-methyltransferase
MNLNILKPRLALNKAFLKVKPRRNEIELFKSNLVKLIDRINEAESEEFHKNLVIDFLSNTYYGANHFINTKGHNDLVIHNGKDAKSTVGVIIEAKKPTNRSEMVRKDNINTKAFQELVLYYLRERITNKNLEIKYLIATNIYEWFIFDAQIFEKLFTQNKQLIKQFTDFEEGRLSGNTTDFFYREIAMPAIAAINIELSFACFDIRDYEKPLRNDDNTDDNTLIALYKLLSPENLLKLPFANDSNSLDRAFYSELLHIIGLTETKDGSKKLIERKKERERNSASLIESTIEQLESLGSIDRLPKPHQYGANYNEQLFSVALELSITWINRILFLKLLEAQLIKYHKGSKEYSFLNPDKVKNFDDLNSLFFSVLARKTEDRKDNVKKLFADVPYLNSSLFEPTELEYNCIFISNLKDENLPIFTHSVLKDSSGAKRTGAIPVIEYLFGFLDSYDFSSEGSEDIQEDNKQLINASVLGLIFEKINGYKDGSFFTPGFITMYMCRETLRRAILQKFNEAKNWNCADFNELYNEINNTKEANEIVNSIKICDPAVGSGHFLVSALNEIISIKSELGILVDRQSRKLKDYNIEVANDELVITDEDGKIFEYNPNLKESQRVQEAIFHEKQTIIENCLFGVDINPNSVKICRLRLWIELLKNSYYKPGSNELETLPNIDINIKCGNSLISRYALDADIKTALKKSKWSIDSYRLAIMAYRNAQNKEQKRDMVKLIEQIKSDFESEVAAKDRRVVKLNRLQGELMTLTTQTSMFEMSKAGKAKWEKEVKAKSHEINKLERELEEIKSNKIYENAFEWRFEFPEVLNDDGDFIGFDVVIGNPPYISLSKIKEFGDYFINAGFKTYSKGSDIYCLFYERADQLLRSKGLLTFITSNSWLRAIYGDLLKKYFVQNMQPIILLNIEDLQIFEEATVESNIITLKKTKDNTQFIVSNLRSDYSKEYSLSTYFVNNCFNFIIPETYEWNIGNEETTTLKKKIEKDTKLLKDFDIKINFGIKTGYNKAFIIDEETKSKLVNEDIKCAEILKPILRGRDLKKYSLVFSNQWLICTFPSLKIDIEKYPSINNYLNGIGKYRLEQSGKEGARKRTNNNWFETQDTISYWKDFEKPKIIWGEISDKPKFAYDESNYYAEATTFLLTGEYLKYLLAILNSTVSEWYFNQISTTTGMGTNRWKKYKIELLPIKNISEIEQQPFIEKVNQILSLKKAYPQADTRTLEKEIDSLVYELYGLTEEEIKIVEG